MRHLPLRVALVAPSGVASRDRLSAVVSGAHRVWFHPKRTEPFAACVSPVGLNGDVDQLLAQLEASFRSAPRYSTTTSLSRALLAAHATLQEANQSLPPEHQRYASALVAAARPNGIYVARAGRALVASVQRRGVWARSADPSGGGPDPGDRVMGRLALPHPINEFFGLEAGDVVMLLPGVTLSDVADQALAAALRAPLDLPAVSELLRGAPAETIGLVVWCLPGEALEEVEPHWIEWSAATRSMGAPRASVERQAAPARPDQGEPAEPTPPPEPAVERPSQADGARELVAARRGTSPSAARPPDTWPHIIGLLPLAALLAFAFLLMRGVLPTPTGADQSVANAWRIMQEALAHPDQDAAAGLLSDAIAILELRAHRDEAARVLLNEAYEARDRARNILRVARVHRFPLPATEGFRPAGLWKTPEGLFILDLGGQLLYRTDPTGTQLMVALRPGDAYRDQPLGQVVTAAWSPPRGAGSEGQLLLVDHLRTLVALTPSGAPARRWWPTDSIRWQRIGPSAATHEDLFLLDTGRGDIWRYPARLSGGAGSMVANATDEPRLSTAVDLATDGNLYVLFRDGAITKISPGVGRLPFDGTVPDQSLGVPTALFAHPDLEGLWVLEPGAFRVVEFTAQGSYVRQYVFPPEMLQGAVGLHVDGRERELRVLTPQHVLLVQMD